MSDTKSAIVLRKNGSSVKEIKIPNELNINKLDLSLLPDKYTNGAKLNSIERECDFDYIEKTISIFAFNKGTAGNENKTELPPPLDKQLYFNNIFVIAHNNNKVVDLSKSEYEEFYETSFGGFDDINSEDSWSEEEESNSEDREFIVNDDEEIEQGSESEEEEEYMSEEETEESDEELNLESDSSGRDKESPKSSKKNSKKLKDKKKEEKSNTENKKTKKDGKKTKEKKKTDEISIQEEEDELVNSYVISLSSDFTDSPKEFKEIVYKHHDKNSKYVLKWIVHKLNSSPDEYKDLYLKYRTLVQ